MSTTWSYYIIALVLLNIIGCGIFLFKTNPQPKEEQQNKLHGHIWDDDLQELNNPLPRWWLVLFYLTIVFALAYLVLYPGLGRNEGALKWQSTTAYEAEKARFEAHYNSQFDRYMDEPVQSLAQNPLALQTAHNLFLQHCSACHGSDARGAKGFPNLTDNDWLHGNSPAAVTKTITDGRQGMMPAFASQLSEQERDQLSTYILNFTGRAGFDKKNIAAGKTLFATYCSVCHGSDALGNQQLGAPNLTDNVWLYGGEKEEILATLAHGRQGVMPAHKDLISESKIHLLTAYVLSLSLEEHNTQSH